MKKLPTTVVCIIIFLLALYATNVAASSAILGVKAGDTIRYDITYSGTSPEAPGRTEWNTIEIIDITGTTVTYRQTDHLFDGSEINRTTSETVTNGTTSLMQSGLFIPVDLKTGDTLSLISGISPMQIVGEVSQTYAEASRSLVWAKYSFMGVEFTNYWDKETGVLVESQQVTQDNDSSKQKLTETNLWSGENNALSGWLPWVIIAVALVIVISLVLFQRARRDRTQPKTASI